LPSRSKPAKSPIRPDFADGSRNKDPSLEPPRALTLIRKGEEGRAWMDVARSDIIVDWTGQKVDESILLGSTID